MGGNETRSLDVLLTDREAERRQWEAANLSDRVDQLARVGGILDAAIRAQEKEETDASDSKVSKLKSEREAVREAEEKLKEQLRAVVNPAVKSALKTS
jgi:hypothetical protein